MACHAASSWEMTADAFIPRVRACVPARSASKLLSAALSALPFAAACGPAPAVDVGIDFSERDAERISAAAGANLDDMPPSEFEGLVRPAGPTPLCEPNFEACGGVLAGLWTVKATCNGETQNQKALQIWGQTFMGLDTTACWDAVQGVTSEFIGEMEFKSGIAVDTRMRRDTIQMTLTRGCLNATFNVNIKADKINLACASLTDKMTSCTPVSGACSCVSRRENAINTAGRYGVLGTQVAIGPDLPPDRFDYCVNGDKLIWRQTGFLRHVVMERQGDATAIADPVYREDPR